MIYNLVNIVFLSKFTPENSYGGAEVSAWYTAKGLVNLGNKVTFFRQVKDLKQPRLNEYNVDGIKVVETPGLFGRDVLSFEKMWADQQAKILKRYLPKKIDIIHSHDQHSLLINYSLKKLLKNTDLQHIHTVRDYTPICGYNHLRITDEVCPRCSWKNFKTCPKVVQGNWLQKPIRIHRFLTTIPYHQRALTDLDKVVFISKFIKQEVLTSPNWRQNILKPKKTTVIYNPAPDWQCPGSSKKIKGKFRLLFVGRLEHHKGIGLLLEAMNLAVARKNFKATLDIVGNGEIDKYTKIAGRFGLGDIVSFKGKVLHKDMPLVYGQADLLVHPSIWPEPFGRGIIEAMACSLPTLAADWGAPRELINDEKNGFLFRTNNQKDLADKILQLSQANIKIEVDFDRFNFRRIAGKHQNFYLK